MTGNSGQVRVDSFLTAVSSKPVESGKTHELSALDHAMGVHTLHLVFYYKKKPFQHFDLDPLRVSLSEVLSLYPAVTGRLTRNGKTGNWEVKCNDAGVRVVRAEVGTTIDEWLRSAQGLEEKDLTVWEEMPEDPSNWSPFRIQVNEFEGGGLAIGISCTHMHADPTSIILLFKSWIETHLKEPIEHPPLFQTHTVHGQGLPETNTKFIGYYTSKANAQAPSVKMATATFKFSNSTIKQCLDEVDDECPNASPFDLLAALFWTCVTRLKGPKNDHEHSISVVLDSRRLVQPPLPLGYFGNALHFSQLSLTREEMDCSKLGQVVAMVHRHVSEVGKEEVESVIQWHESRKEEGGKYAPPFKMYGPELTCVSMEHMIVGHTSVMYAATFEETEKPLHVSCHVGNVEGEGLIMVMPSLEEGLARTVMVTLPEEEMAKLLEDHAIMRLQPTMLLNGGTKNGMEL
ncbi:hypothetical protein Tsubulata_009563 [Turnera subulata]|uniref:Uncharacterized protein n=1 Tax=Turnera subulata TaxID=218843 RepID=A0A9Q0G3H9_9ROSI|nr:hypothetical protein Tsubulata_009563 [Turnera subulata]